MYFFNSSVVSVDLLRCYGYVLEIFVCVTRAELHLSLPPNWVVKHHQVLNMQFLSVENRNMRVDGCCLCACPLQSKIVYAENPEIAAGPERSGAVVNGC